VIGHNEAQELHQCIGQGLERQGDYLVALERAQELASVMVSDTDPEGEVAKALAAVLDAAVSWRDELSDYIIPSAAETCGDDAEGYKESYDKLGAALALLGRLDGYCVKCGQMSDEPQPGPLCAFHRDHDEAGLLNIDPSYWTARHPQAVEELAGLTNKATPAVAAELALIAGDRATMPDDEVVATFRGDNDLPEEEDS
jgi:hypothetical protein